MDWCCSVFRLCRFVGFDYGFSGLCCFWDAGAGCDCMRCVPGLVMFLYFVWCFLSECLGLLWIGCFICASLVFVGLLGCCVLCFDWWLLIC